MSTSHSQPTRDVIIIGGGAAGLNAALVLARARRSVTVVDARQPRNAPSAAAHGMLGNEGINPLELLDRGRAEAQSYGAEILTATVDAARPDEEGYLVRLHDGRELKATQLVIATGVRDVLPDIEGLSARWGKDVIHCPYCHGLGNPRPSHRDYRHQRDIGLPGDAVSTVVPACHVIQQRVRI